MTGTTMSINTLHRALRCRVARNGDDAGIAMIFVVCIIMMMTALATTSLAFALQGQPQAKRDQNWAAALTAAQAGVADYVSRLNKSDAYARSVDCANIALKGPKAGTNTCGWTNLTPAGWANADETGDTVGQFHYDVSTATLYRDGAVLLNSTGRVNGVTRTIQVRVSRGGSTQFLYYTDFEDADPANTVAYPGGATQDCGGSGASLAKYWYQGRSGCAEIQFAGSDVLDGQVHFNDTPLMSNAGGTRPRFLQGFETADFNCTAALGKGDASGVGTSAGQGKCWRTGSSAYPYVGTNGAGPALALTLPDNSDQFATFPGCVYTGDTRIRFKSDGTMDVWNTTSAGTSLLGPGTPAGTNCGTDTLFVPGPGGAPTAPQNVPVPNDMVIYVKNTGSSAVCNPGQVVNGSASGSSSGDIIPLPSSTSADGSSATKTYAADVTFFNPSSLTTTYTQSWSKASGSWLPTSASSPAVTPTGDAHQATFDCGQGNAYVEGTVKGRVTVGAQNNVIVTDDLLIDGTAVGAPASGSTLVGLVASNSVAVYHPVTRASSSLNGPTVAKTAGSNTATCPSTQTTTPSSGGTSLTCTYVYTRTASSTYSDLLATNLNRYVYASIQTLQHSFWVNSYNKGNDLGNLVVRGSIAQKWRGAVGTSGGTGFAKDYGYDSRLQFAAPPYFPQWTNATWGAKTTGELTPQYKTG